MICQLFWSALLNNDFLRHLSNSFLTIKSDWARWSLLKEYVKYLAQNVVAVLSEI